jgi:hypothetical protein
LTVRDRIERRRRRGIEFANMGFAGRASYLRELGRQACRF